MQVLAEKSPQKATIPLCKNGQNTTKTRNSGTVFKFYCFGARYLDPRTSRWISADPAVGDYIPQAPANDDARKHNQNLPGMGGVYNLVNLHVYHYAGNNPVKYVDPDGKFGVDPDNNIISADLADINDLNAALNSFQVLQHEGYKVVATDKQTGSSIEYYNYSAMNDGISRMSGELDYSSPEAFLSSLGLMGDIISFTGELLNSASTIGAGNIINAGVTAASAINNGMNWNNYSTEEKTMAGVDFAVNLIGFAGLPGAGVSILYSGAKAAAPSVYQGIRAINQQALKPTYNYLDIIGAPQGFYDILRKF